MQLPEPLMKSWLGVMRAGGRLLVIDDDGITLGKTLLAPMRKGEMHIDVTRIAALLSVAYGQSIGTAIVRSFHHAVRCYKQGNKALASMHLALTGLHAIDLDAAQRMFLAEKLMDAGIGPKQLLKLVGILRKDDDDEEDDSDDGDGDDSGSGDDGSDGSGNSHYNPDEPRIPAGQPGGGQWTTAGNGVASDPGGISADDIRSALREDLDNYSTDSLPQGTQAAGQGLEEVIEYLQMQREAEQKEGENPSASAEEVQNPKGASVDGTAGDVTAPTAANTLESKTDQELGTDTDSGQFRQGELDTAKLLQEKVGPLQRSPDKAYDWIDAEGTTYDAVGPVPSQYLNTDSFNGAIDNHLLKQGLDKVVVNITNLTTEQRADVEAHIGNLSVQNQTRILLLK